MANFAPELNKDYFYYILSYKTTQEQFIAVASGGTSVDNLNIEKVAHIQIPCPPLPVQQKIVSEIEVLETKENAVKASINIFKANIKNKYIEEVKPKFEKHILSGEIDLIGGGTPSKEKPEYWENGTIDWLSIVDFKGENRFVETTEKKITELGLKNSNAKLLNADDIVISARGTVGELAQLKNPMAFNQSCYGIKAKENIDSGFLYYALKFEIEQFKNNAYGAIFDAITTKTFDLIKIPVPPLPEQQKIVAEIEKIEAHIAEAQRELDTMPERKNAILRKYL
jgi:restriction endonuclease S subunit